MNAPPYRIPDGVMLDDFERLLTIGGALQQGDQRLISILLALDCIKFLARDGDRLLELARAGHAAMERQSKEPT